MNNTTAKGARMNTSKGRMYTELQWVDAYRDIAPYMVKVVTPDAYGSGFVMDYRSFGKKVRQITIATACHVVKHADDWAEMIRIEHTVKGDFHSYQLPSEGRAIVADEDKDIALLTFCEGKEPHFPKELLVTIDGKDKDFRRGVLWAGVVFRI